MFFLIVFCGSLHNLSQVAISVAIERDWITVIADGSSAHLTTINTYMRRIDLLCKLLAPLFVSLLTSVASYPFAAYFLCGVEAGCMFFELLCMCLGRSRRYLRNLTRIVYRDCGRLPPFSGAQICSAAKGRTKEGGARPGGHPTSHVELYRIESQVTSSQLVLRLARVYTSSHLLLLCCDLLLIFHCAKLRWDYVDLPQGRNLQRPVPCWYAWS